MTYHVHNADVMEWAKRYDGPLFHSFLSDCPYHLTEPPHARGHAFGEPRTDKERAARKGFMNSTWDGGDIAFRVEFWAAMKDLLYPGAFGFAFASTRGYHRMAVAIEDAGFIIHPMLAYCFGSGFPKATRIDTQIDAAAGAERKVIGKHPNPGSTNRRLAIGDGWQEEPDITAPATEPAQAWQGHRYGLQAMKPALEPICVFQKPYEGKPVDCMVRTGAGALHIDAGRVGNDTIKTQGGVKFKGDGSYNAYNAADESYHSGRWPSNLILGHSAACTEHGCAADCAVEAMGRQSGVSVSKSSQRGSVKVFSDTYRTHEGWQGESTERGHDDEGTAARFFHQTDWELEKADPFFYTAKSSTAEREAGLEHFTPTTTDDGRNTPIDNPYLRGETTRRNIHPTLKPLSLTKYLASLLLPPDAYAPRRLLVPFSGVSSEMIGAMLAGWDEIHGIELSPEYCEIAAARLAFWSQRRHLAHVKLQQVKPVPQQQATLFDTLQY